VRTDTALSKPDCFVPHPTRALSRATSDAASTLAFAAPKFVVGASRRDPLPSSTRLTDAWVDNIFSMHDGVANSPVESDAELDDTTLSMIVQELSKRKLRRLS
jgi:hypothetical protein